ncbi:MAG: sulfotransferase domain-containing protein [Xenococcaceae cyanobacterium MO_167.B27]|nr:sulfotransferase domain-containing protein [Xenococcaceae cyanobacterium MO_167.B27]
MKSKRLDFIGIGVHKSATTWIAKCLEEHPDIRFSKVLYNKELYFFNREDRYQLGYEWYHQGFEFGFWKNGEFSPLYFPDSTVPQRIYKYNPNIKLLLSLRNPIDRAFSHHLDEIRGGNLPKNKLNFWDALEENPNYIKLGKYASQLESYLDFFKPHQIHIVLYEDIQSDSEVVLQKIFQFLGVDPTHKSPTFEKKINVSHSYRIPQVNNFIKSTSRFIRSVVGDRVAENIKKTGVLVAIENLNNVSSNISITPPFSEDDRKRLYNIFEEEIERLAILIDRDLSHWN